MSDMREAFEEAAARLGYKLVVANPADQTGEYRDVETEDAWAMWQEACAWQAARAQGACEWAEQLDACEFHANDHEVCAEYSGQVPCARAQSGQGAEPASPGDPLPCPFCGSTDVGGAGGTVGCYRCPAEIAVQNANTAYAVELWNNRVANHPQPAVPEGLVARIKNLLLALGHQGTVLDEGEPPYDVGEWGIKEAQELYTLLSTPTKPKPAVPEGWTIRLQEDGRIYFSAPSGARGSIKRRLPNDDEPISDSTLDRAFFDLCSDLLSTPITPQPAQQGSVPEGWKLVPIEPTDEMRRKAGLSRGADYYTISKVWREMLAAAPKPPQEGA